MMETMSIFHRQPRGWDVVGGLLQSAWRYKRLIAAAVLLGALLGYGWASRQPTLYEGVSRVRMARPCGYLPIDGPICDPDWYLGGQAQLMSSSAVLQHAVKLSGSSISAETLGQHLEVDVAQDPTRRPGQELVITIQVVDSTAKGAAQLANAVTLAYQQVAIQQERKIIQGLRRHTLSHLETRLANIDAELAGRPNNGDLRRQRDAFAAQLSQIEAQLTSIVAATRVMSRARREVAAVPEQPIQPRPGRTITMAIGMLLGLLVSAALAWWLTRRHGPTSRSSAPEQGPEMPSPA
jgi:uncharacterized protein involved in exopolysaccharide biosynthesis